MWAAHPWRNWRTVTELRYFCTIATHSTADSMRWKRRFHISRSSTQSKRIRLSPSSGTSYCVGVAWRSHLQASSYRLWPPDVLRNGFSSQAREKRMGNSTLQSAATLAKFTLNHPVRQSALLHSAPLPAIGHT